MQHPRETQDVQFKDLQATLLGDTLKTYDKFSSGTIDTVERVAEILLPAHNPERRLLQFEARPRLRDMPYDSMEYQLGVLVAASVTREIEPREGVFLPKSPASDEIDWLDCYIKSTAQNEQRYVVAQWFANSKRGQDKISTSLGHLGALGFRYANHQDVHEADGQSVAAEYGDQQDFTIVGMGDLLAWVHAHRTGLDAPQKMPLI